MHTAGPAILAFIVISICACSGGRPSQPTATPEPQRIARAGVPASAEQVRADVEFGNEAPAPDDSRPDVFYSMRCTDNLLVLATTREIVYAELPCERALPDPLVHPFLDRAVRIQIMLGEQHKLTITARSAGSIIFTVGTVWIRQT